MDIELLDDNVTLLVDIIEEVGRSTTTSYKSVDRALRRLNESQGLQTLILEPWHHLKELSTEKLVRNSQKLEKRPLSGVF